VLCQRTFISVFRAVFLHSYTAQFNLVCMGPFTTLHKIRYYAHIYSVVSVVCSVYGLYNEA
jgi:hypothetical protein